MSGIPWLEPQDAFPPVECALDNPNGLLAAGADLSPSRLYTAYSSGIFPWYEEGQPLLWWSPEPRAILRPTHIKLSKSLRKRLKRGQYQVYLNRDFPAVIRACSEPRSYADGTWITSEMQAAYIALHQQGLAHSVETYLEDQLVGGLYGVAVGNLFCGESMFHRATDASKVAFAHLCWLMHENGSPLIDCQLENDHLVSLGCEMIPRASYLTELSAAKAARPVDWRARELVYDWKAPIISP